ncbi:heterokaryon incompatibility protein-domain-containing protein [Pisolithus tinctorius]|uniref:Uncharacterized protein n=1 Tax=Pisolithus tinctorius Marx 270 TaxID=870435 RepID=A0A0C3PQH9_PISTI|nr:heterokaryon incompatibility protein-domain-containing protein [Pisolithus tinctorius]KIO10784.1 hypothetical protein M404DRAFT_995245 [Pisolithus tinctorius Marx 270]
MRLLYVKAVLERENNVQKVGPKSEVLRELDDRTVHYAILSHRWGSEVSYEELIGLMAMGEQDRAEVRSRDGYQKIIRSCERAMQDGYTWLWIDTCCIDKRSSAELSEAINSMYRWYQNSQKCYAYLNDVEESTFPPERNDSKFGRSNGWPEWFERGWTLQELIAPKRIEFFNKNWVSIGSKASLADMLQKVTHIPREVLLNTPTEQRPCIAQIMSWAADRKTTRVEDRAYSLMGLFGVNMPMLYGEGQKAFQRLQLEIIRASSDHTIFAWDPFGRIRRPGNILADDPSYFRGCHRIKQVEPAHFVFDLTRYIRQHELSNHWFNNVTRRHRLASWHDIVHGQQYRTISITNTGVQVWLPVIPYHGSLSTVKAVVASHQMELVTIDLAFYRSAFERSFDPTGIYKTYPEFKALCLAYTDETRHDLKLDDTNASYHGFTRCGTFPREITGDTVTLLSHVSDLIVVVYTNSDARSRFAVGLGYYSDLGWVHVACDESSTNQEETGTPWADFAKKAYDMMWGARAHHAQQGTPAHGYNGNSIKHAHFPRSIWAARVAWGRWNTGNSTVVVDVEQCPGCCLGPIARTDTTNDRDGLDMPGLMMITLPSHRLLLDGRSVWLHECSRGTSLGDYGDCIGGNFTRHGNIFEDMRTLGIDPENPAYHPVVNRFSSTSDEEFAATIISRSDDSMLSRPIGLSLPSSRHFVLLLKALSTHLSDKHLVITNVQYSHHGWETRIGSNEDSKMDNGSRSTKPGDFTTLCSVASPQVWRRQLACVQRRKRFREIREHFYALVNPVHALLTIPPTP